MMYEISTFDLSHSEKVYCDHLMRTVLYLNIKNFHKKNKGILECPKKHRSKWSHLTVIWPITFL